MRLKDFSLTQGQIGLFFTIGGVAYTISSFAVTMIDTKVWSKRTLIMIGLFLTIFANLLTGPSTLAGLPDILAIIGTGQAFMGLFGPLLIVFSLPLMIDIVDNEFHHLSEKRKSQAYDFSGGLFNSFLYFGQISGPIYGTNMT